MKKVVYISYLPLTVHLKKNFFISNLEQGGVSVEYWDISSLYFTNLVIADEVKIDTVKKIKSKRKIIEKVRGERNQQTVFIPLISFGLEVLWLHKLLNANNCHTAFLGRGFIPHPHIKLINKFLICAQKGELGKLWTGLLNRIIFKLNDIGLIKGYDVVFAAGTKGINHYRKKSKIVEINHFDYDDFLKTKNGTTRLVEEQYAVFIDEYAPYHPDRKMFNMKIIDADNYFLGLNDFFEIVEKKWNLSVVIAAHPKSDYKHSVYNGRKMFKYKTNELIKDSEFVLAHSSTSLSFAVLYNKRVLLLYNDKIKSYCAETNYARTVSFSKTIGSPMYNVDATHNADQVNLPVVNKEKYTQYKYDYLTSPHSEDELTENIFLDFIKKYDVS